VQIRRSRYAPRLDFGPCSFHALAFAICTKSEVMIRKAFRMSVHAGHEAEYARRHNPIWRELEDLLLAHGVRTYSIYLDETTRDLFGYVEVEDETRWQAIAQTEICQRWWRYMREIMPANPDNSPVAASLREVFHLESGQRR
jgi:L-rhamnose mutarotase